MPRVWRLTLAATAVLLAIGQGALAGNGDTDFLSRQSLSAGGDGADAGSAFPSTSANGRFTAFQTDARNLGGPARNVTNIYVHDLRTHETKLVSRRSDGGAGGNGSSQLPSISNDGRFIAFYSSADNLGGPIDPSASSNVYVHDRQTHKTTLVSRESDGGPGGDSSSREPSISANGRFVAFQTFAENLGGPVEAGVRNIYVHDRQQRRTQLVSRRSDGGAGADDDSLECSISADGRFVAFDTSANNLGGPLDPDFRNIYLYDRKERKTDLVSRRSNGGVGADGNSDSAEISDTGRLITFQTNATNLGGPIGTAPHIYVHDRKQRKTELISRQGGGGAGADGSSQDPTISGDGDFVAFETGADNLGGPIKDVQNVYAYDRDERRIKLVSRRSGSGVGGNANSFDPSISADERFVAFQTLADNLGGPLDTDFPNIYIHQFRR